MFHLASEKLTGSYINTQAPTATSLQELGQNWPEWQELEQEEEARGRDRYWRQRQEVETSSDSGSGFNSNFPKSQCGSLSTSRIALVVNTRSQEQPLLESLH